MIRLGLQILVLVMLAVWIGGEIATLWVKVDVRTQSAAHPGTAVVEPNTGKDLPEPAPKLDATAFPQTFARPIFFAERRFPTKPIKAASKPQAQPSAPAEPKISADKIKLRGVMLTNGKKRALLESPSGTSAWIGLDEMIDGWTVSALGANAITLKQSGSSATITLYPETP
jgi:hypothetical protein